ncbi:MAG TPA: hypothetical protein VFV90_03640, partial [Usitatibacter sp.]|nr:hypothetical protein [Usitatibacter sp.]
MPLRVGVFAASARQPRWIVEALARAGASGFAEVTLVSLKKTQPGSGPGLTPILWRAYAHADRALARGWRSAESRQDLAQLVQPEHRIEEGERCWRARIQAARLDVAFVLGEVDIAGIAKHARYGAWRFCFGEGHDACEALAAVHEAIEDSPVVASGIRIHRPGKPDRLACRSWSRTYLSVTRSRASMFAKTGDFLLRALRGLHAGGCKWIENETELVAEPQARAFPGTPKLLRGLTSLSTRVVRRAAEKALKLETWSIAYRFGPDEDWNGSLDGWKRLDPPAGWFWADPFPIERDGRYWIFFEELPHGASKAHISVVEVRKDGTTWGPVKVLERPYHLSYPFLVEEGGELYMVPETADNNTVEVYRCVEFPAKWQLERVLLEGVRCVDATLHREGARWWMFANAAVPGAELNDELAIYSADSLLGEWRPHRRNPVKSDVRSSRPAGRLFRRGDGLYRPGQICTPLYGAGIAVHRVTRLTAEEYAEEEAARIEPRDAGTLGIHT